tara:strand:+ start:345 stop:869 length:525 start_codon:yes stop_codon:yes gene_type:complete
MKKIIISAFTNDQPGIISKISGKVSSLNGNIIKSKMMKIDNIFSVVMVVNIQEKNEKTLIDQMNQIPELYSIVKNIDTVLDDDNKYNRYSFTLECIDNEGIIHHFTKYLNKEKINIEKMDTNIHNAPVTGATLFKLDSILWIPIKYDLNKIKNNLEQLSEQFNVNFSLLLLKSK